MKGLRWGLICAVSFLAGTSFALLTIFGLISGWEHRIALGLLIAVTLSISMVVRTMPVRHALVSGFVSALLAIWLQAAFLPVYLRHNPTVAAALIEEPLPLDLNPRAFTVLFAPLGGVLAGSLCALLAALVGTLRKGPAS